MRVRPKNLVLGIMLMPIISATRLCNISFTDVKCAVSTGKMPFFLSLRHPGSHMGWNLALLNRSLSLADGGFRVSTVMLGLPLSARREGLTDLLKICSIGFV